MSKTNKEIIAAIRKRIKDTKKGNYAIWRIGLTHNPTLRKEQHGDPKYWLQWKASSLSNAQNVEDYFLNEFPENSMDRMSGGTGGNMDSSKKDVYVYIY